MLVQFAVGADYVVLLMFDLRENLPRGGLSLPLPVEPRHAAGQQLAGLLQLRFLRIHFANPGLDPGAIFPPQIELPASGQAEGAVGVPRPGGACSRVGKGKRPHQPFGGHFLAFRIGGKINLRTVSGHCGFGLGFGKRNALAGNLHIRCIAQRFRNQPVIRFPPLIFRPVLMIQNRIHRRRSGLRFNGRHRGMFRRTGCQNKNEGCAQR